MCARVRWGTRRRLLYTEDLGISETFGLQDFVDSVVRKLLLLCSATFHYFEMFKDFAFCLSAEILNQLSWDVVLSREKFGSKLSSICYLVPVVKEVQRAEFVGRDGSLLLHLFLRKNSVRVEASVGI